jgi:hypothetical protein
VVLTLAVLLAAVAGAADVDGGVEHEPEIVLDHEVRDVGGFRVSVSRGEDDRGMLSVSRQGKQLFRRTQDHGSFRLGGLDRERYVEPGKDITGEGEPNLVVVQWNGGAHCCFLFHVFSLGRRFRLVASLDAAYGDLSHFEDLGGDGVAEFIANDWTFAYWHEAFAQSPAPRIVLRFRHGRYEVAPDLMRTPEPTKEELAVVAARVRGTRWALIAGEFLDLAYGGHLAAANELIELAWTGDQAGARKFVRALWTQVSKSPYFVSLFGQPACGSRNQTK